MDEDEDREGKGSKLWGLAGKAKQRVQTDLAKVQPARPPTLSRRATKDTLAAQADAAATAGLLTVMSHEHGRNATVTIYPDRVERVKPKKLSSLNRADQGAEVIPMSTISAVKTTKDGLLFTKVSVMSFGGEIDFRVSHADGEKMRNVIAGLLLKRENDGRTSGGAVPIGGSPSIADELKKLAELRDAGVLSPAEFEAQKAKVLGA